MSSFSTITPLLLLSLWSVVISQDDRDFIQISIPKIKSGPASLAFYPWRREIYTGVSGGKILKYTPETGFVDYAQMTEASKETICDVTVGRFFDDVCGRPMGIAFNEKTNDLYVADASLGLHVVSPAGGLAVKITDSVDGKPLRNLDGLDVDPITGVVYFTSLSASLLPYQLPWSFIDATGKLYKYDPSTKVVSILLEGLFRSTGCAVSSDGSFVLVSQFTKNNIKKYWIKGPKTGLFEDFTNSILNPNKISRVGSTGNFWIASVVNNNFGPTNQSAVKVNSNGEVVQTIFLKDKTGDTWLSEVKEVNGSLYLGTPTGNYVGILKL